MIITVTLNPALDKTARCDVLRPNALNRLRDVSIDAGGKGVNVSAMIRVLGGNSIATGFAGGGAGEELIAGLAGKGLEHDFVRIASVTRTNLKVINDAGNVTELNEPGPEITGEEFAALEKKLAAFGTKGNTFILSGSLPRGIKSDAYKKLCGTLRQNGAEVFLDADGEALELALDAGPDAVPCFLKPNRYELLKLFGIQDGSEITEAVLSPLCVKLLDKGVSLVCLSLGHEGALFVSREGIRRSPALPVTVKSTVGAGDSMVGALVYGFENGLPQEHCFALAMAASAGACTTEGTNPPSRFLVDELLQQVCVQKIS
ncbi:phosphofructokinase [Spirochaetia bacterium]|nr:phosphofructokinase [Spirochaetia bacterium]